MKILKELVEKQKKEKEKTKDVSYYKKLLLNKKDETIEKIGKVINIIEEEMNIFSDYGSHEPPYSTIISEEKILENKLLVPDTKKIIELIRSNPYLALPKNDEIPQREWASEKDLIIGETREEKIIVVFPKNDWHTGLQDWYFKYPYEQNFKNLTEALEGIKKGKSNEEESRSTDWFNYKKCSVTFRGETYKPRKEEQAKFIKELIIRHQTKNNSGVILKRGETIPINNLSAVLKLSEARIKKLKKQINRTFGERKFPLEIELNVDGILLIHTI